MSLPIIMNYSFSLTMEQYATQQCAAVVALAGGGGGDGGATEHQQCSANLPKFETHRNS
jgi:hypothetical protein